MSRSRKLSADEEAAIIAWYAQYRGALSARAKAREQLREIGSPAQKAKQLGVSARGLHLIVKREQYELRRKVKLAGIRITSEQSLFARVPPRQVQTRPTLTNVSAAGVNDRSAKKTRTPEGAT